MASCRAVREFLLCELEKDIAAHERGEFARIGEAEKFLPSREGCAQENEERLSVAWNFWDSWMDARNHDWGYYPGVERDDWPVIARQICQGLREGWSADEMWDNPAMNPPRSPKVAWWRRLFRTS